MYLLVLVLFLQQVLHQALIVNGTSPVTQISFDRKYRRGEVGARISWAAKLVFQKGAQLFPAQLLVPYHTVGSTYKGGVGVVHTREG